MSLARAALPALLLMGCLATRPALGETPASGGEPGDGAAGAAPSDVSRLAFRHVSATTDPTRFLAQRVIDREWGLSDDSIYVEKEVVGWKSEPLATSLSAVLPGTGQLYAGRNTGWLYLAAEAAGWGGWWWYRRDARQMRDDAAGVAGSPDDPASGWSFERWATATEGNPAEIAALYAADREAFYDRIASDPAYQSGWESSEARARFVGLETGADQRLHRSRLFSAGLWLNHLVAAIDALRVTRFHNMPLNDFVQLKIDGRMARRGPTMRLALERKF
jgi:hypothetical protein